MSVIEKGAPLMSGRGGDESVENFPRSPVVRGSSCPMAPVASHGSIFGEAAEGPSLAVKSSEVVTCVLDLPFDRTLGVQALVGQLNGLVY